MVERNTSEHRHLGDGRANGAVGHLDSQNKELSFQIQPLALPRYRPIRTHARPFQTHVYLHLSNLVVLFFSPLAATFLG
jgi:hypothetical protein